jgi:hypothetical protein
MSNKDSEVPREALDLLRDSLIANDEADAIENDSGSDLSDSTAAAELYKALSLLRTVRVPRKGKLTMEEAIEAASSQHETYWKWRDSGKPVGEIKGWVEGKKVFSVFPPAVFKHIGFDWPPPDDAVLQLTTEADGEMVVLYNLRLTDVGPEGTTETEDLPNGQHIVLTITRQMAAAAASPGSTTFSSQPGKLSINIEVNSQAVGSKSSARDDLPLNTNNRGTRKRHDNSGTNKHRTKFARVKSLMWNWQYSTTFRRPVTAFASMVIVVLLVWLLVPKEPLKVVPSETPTPQDETAKVNENFDRKFIADQPSGALTHNERRETAAGTRSTGSQSLRAGRDSVRRNHIKGGVAKDPRPAIGLELASLLPTSVLPEKKENTANPNNKSADQGNTKSFDDSAKNARLRRHRESEMKRFAVLAALPHVSVRLQNTEATKMEEFEWLRSSFARAFEASPRFAVLKDSDNSKADVVIGLRFERDETTSGVVFVDIRDADGKFIWQDFTDCQESLSTDQSGMFTVAADSLVNKLEEVINISR